MTIEPDDPNLIEQSAADNPLFAELLWVHSMIRRDLATVTELARDAAADAPPAELRERIADLKAGSILWQLKYGCLRHCRFVHAHHRLEDVALFPRLRRVEPAIEPVVDRLTDEHRQVSRLLDEVEAAAEALGGDDDGRAVLISALERLGEVLLAHLSFEEQSLEPVLALIGDWSG